MSIEIKRSVKPVNYIDAIELLEQRHNKVINNRSKELIWFLEHNLVYTGGTSFKESDIIDKKIKVLNTARGGKITCHSPGQLVCYLVIDLNKREKDIRKFVLKLEKSIIETFKEFKIKSNSDRKNVGIWIKHNNKRKKIGAIGLKIKKWVTYHGFAINISNDLSYFKKIVPCGIKDKEVISLQEISKVDIKKFIEVLKKSLIKNLSLSNYSSKENF